jgi:hypothetical protein
MPPMWSRPLQRWRNWPTCRWAATFWCSCPPSGTLPIPWTDCSELDGSHLLLPLFGRLPAADQRRIFRSLEPAQDHRCHQCGRDLDHRAGHPLRGRYRPGSHRPLQPAHRHHQPQGQPHLQASCEQRRGRCGRTGPGTCIRLYSEEDFSVPRTSPCRRSSAPTWPRSSSR